MPCPTDGTGYGLRSRGSAVVLCLPEGIYRGVPGQDSKKAFVRPRRGRSNIMEPGRAPSCFWPRTRHGHRVAPRPLHGRALVVWPEMLSVLSRTTANNLYALSVDNSGRCSLQLGDLTAAPAKGHSS